VNPIENFIVKVKRAETPFYAALKRLARSIITGNLPIPRFLFPLLRMLFLLRRGSHVCRHWFRVVFYLNPLFRGRCESVGKNFRLTTMPEIQGHVKIWIGNDVSFFGVIGIYSGAILAEPKLIFGNRVDIGHNVQFVVNREIVFEDDVNVANGVRFMDSDAHPRDAAERIANLPPPPEEIKPVRICRYAWIGQNSFILKGVTIGEGAIVGVNSVVLTDVPPYSVAMGNPARVVVKNLAKASAAKLSDPVS
jgi:acetyltransferase-like isoleucine patch superfamily enzyme